MKDRNEIIAEMIQQVRGVFQYYTDQRLPKSIDAQLEKVLDKEIPFDYTSNAWNQYAEQKRLEREKQEENNSV